MFLRFIVATLLSSGIAQAQSPAYPADDLTTRNLKQEGQMLSIRIVPGEPLKIFVLGREEAKADLTNLKLTIRRMKPYPAKTLSLSKSGDYFIVNEKNLKGPLELEVNATVKEEKAEKFYFNLDQNLK
jgi:hypothetical protein